MRKKHGGFAADAAVFLLLCMFCVWAAPGENSAAAGKTVTSQSIKDKEAEIAKKRNEKDSLKDSLSNLKEIKKNLESQKASLKDYVEQLDQSLIQIEENITRLQEDILIKKEQIAETEEELDAAVKREEGQRESMVAHLRLVYEKGNTSVVEMVLRARNFGDMLNLADRVERMAAYDHDMLTAYENITAYVDLCRQELELEKEILDETKAHVEQEQKNLEELIEEKTQELKRYEADISNKEKAIREYEAQIQAQENEIKVLEAAVAEERRKLLASNGSAITYDGGKFKFPLASFTAVSDEYGWRINPILGIQEFHNGVDLAAPGGTSIYAAYDGIVVAATYNASMGNYVMINHGDGLYTIYMHASALYVSKDDAVAKGDTIAAVGTTGMSTGNHLHFTVRLNGAYVSPWDYLKQ